MCEAIEVRISKRERGRSRDREVAKSRKENARVSPSSQPKKNAVHRSVKEGDRGGEVKEKKGKRKEKGVMRERQTRMFR